MRPLRILRVCKDCKSEREVFAANNIFVCKVCQFLNDYSEDCPVALVRCPGCKHHIAIRMSPELVIETSIVKEE